jgi:hypothetical protein
VCFVGDSQGRLKDMILSAHPLVFAALEAFDSDGDTAELLDSLMRIALRSRA